MVNINKQMKYKPGTYYQAHKNTVDNPGLSWAAKGMLAYLLSKPPDWTVVVQDLINSSKNGRSSTYTIIKELIAAGHIIRVQLRDSNGSMDGVSYTVYEHSVYDDDMQ